jgi:hypothetical protein
VAVVLTAAPKDYHAVLTAEQRTKAHGGDALTLDDLENAMNDMWRQGTGKHSKNDDDGGNELSLAAFEGQCLNVERKDTVRQHAKIPQTLVEEAEPAGATETHDLMELVTDAESVVTCYVTAGKRTGIKENVLRAGAAEKDKHPMRLWMPTVTSRCCYVTSPCQRIC